MVGTVLPANHDEPLWAMKSHLLVYGNIPDPLQRCYHVLPRSVFTQIYHRTIHWGPGQRIHPAFCLPSSQ